jgi:hypothetical protein
MVDCYKIGDLTKDVGEICVGKYSVVSSMKLITFATRFLTAEVTA